jgi:MYXO-CTERM domain-containing protein
MGDNTTTNDKGFTIGGGCGCQSNAPAPFGLWLLLIVGAFFITRRRRTSRS